MEEPTINPEQTTTLEKEKLFKKIPLALLLANEDQPRHRKKLGSIQALSDSMKAIGQQTDLKVRPLTAEEKVSFLKWDTEWHKAGGAPLKTIGEQGFAYLVIGGHRRLEAAKLAGLETLDCIVLDIKPEETHLASLMDNSTEEMDWWDWDLAIEAEHNAFPDMTQRQLAKRLGVSKGKVSNALLLTKILTPLSKSMIDLNLDQECDSEGSLLPLPEETPENEGTLAQTLGKDPETKGNSAQSLGNQKSDYRITEYVLLALAAIEDPHEITGCLEIIIDNEMPLVRVKKLVEWVINGGECEDFDPKAGSNGNDKGEDPFAEAWKGLGSNLKVKHKGGEDYEIKLAITGGQKALDAARAAQKALQGGLAARLVGFLNELDNSKS